MRVIVAAEPRRMQAFLTDVVERHASAVVVGRADNAVDTLTAVNDLSPDVTIIDSNLPYSVGLDAVAFSRASGLDVAQGISERKPGMQVILLTNLGKSETLGQTMSPHNATFYHVGEGPSTPFTLDDLPRPNSRLRGMPVFAGIGLSPTLPPVVISQPRGRPARASLKQKVRRIGFNALFWGVLSIVGGLLMVASWALLPVGLVVVAGGLAAVAFGLVTRLLTRPRRNDLAALPDPWRVAG